MYYDEVIKKARQYIHIYMNNVFILNLNLNKFIIP
jgi:hypothetical protein